MPSLELGCGLRPTPNISVYHDSVKHSDFVQVTHDLNQLPWPWPDDQFDLVVANNIFEHLKLEVFQWLNEAWRIVCTGGRLEFVVPHWGTFDAHCNPTHRKSFDPMSFDFWDPSKEYWAMYGRYDPELAASGKFWSIKAIEPVGNSIRFQLDKLPAKAQ